MEIKRTRTIKKQFWFNTEEQQALSKLAQKAKTNESDIIRRLVLESKIKEKPDDKFYESLKIFRSLANNMNQIAKKAHSLGFIDELSYQKNVDMIKQFTEKIKDEYLREDKQ